MRSFEPVIVVRKQKARPERHHGGAWKVAYADFVTAMMALFIVLWLMNSEPDVKQSVAGFFKDPTGARKETGAAVGGSGEAQAMSPQDLGKLKNKIEDALREMSEFKHQLGKQVELTITGEGLRIELVENDGGLLFQSASAVPTEQGKKLLATLAQQLGRVPNPVFVEGHTDAVPFGEVGRYSNWELSSDRANSARRLMESGGLRPKQVKQVRGFADVSLRYPDRPKDAANRRITVIVGLGTEVKPRKA